MLARFSSISPFHISMLSLVAGFLLMISGYVPLAVIGAGLILFSFLLPFLRLGIKPNPPAARTEPPDGTDNDVTSTPVAATRPEEDAR